MARSDEEAVLAAERRALDRWSQGDAQGYFGHYAADATYFDDIAAQLRIEGAAIREYAKSLEGKVPAHRYEVVDPKVQVLGDVAVLTLRYHPFAPDGKALQRWRATTVYRRERGDWRLVHGNWTMLKD